MRSTNKEVSFKAAIAEAEANGLKQGFGEIIDMGELSKDEIRQRIAKEESEIEDEVANARETADFFADDFDEDEIRSYHEKIIAKLRARLDTAPDTHIYDFKYFA